MRQKSFVAKALIVTMMFTGVSGISFGKMETSGVVRTQTVEVATDSNAAKVPEVVVSDQKEQRIVATPSEAIRVSTEEELREALWEGGEIELEQEIVLTEPLEIFSGTTVHLSGGGLSRKAVPGQISMINVFGNAEISFSHIVIDATGSTDVNDFYTINSSNGSRVYINEGTELITTDSEYDVKKRKVGLRICGIGEMSDGIIKGFHTAGVSVFRTGEFTLTGGAIEDNGKEASTDGHGIFSSGIVHITGGSITGCKVGVVNRKLVTMEGGIISNNRNGIDNSNYDALSHEEYSPELILSGGSISGDNIAIANSTRGKVTISGDCEISGKIKEADVLQSVLKASGKRAIILNMQYGVITMEGGTIAVGDNEVGILNEDTGILSLNSGQIVINGVGSTAITNENTTVGQAKINGGQILVLHEGSTAFENEGDLQISSEAEIDADVTGEYLVAVSFSEGGKVTPNTQMVKAGNTVTYIAVPESGYKIADFIVDGVSLGAVNTSQLTVTGRHTIEVQFKKSQSSSSSGGGSSSSGRSGSAIKDIIPATPGLWSQDQNGWRFIKADGSLYRNTWIYVNGQWYYIGTAGYMLEGQHNIGESWYYLMPVTGEMKTGWMEREDKWYYYYADGHMAFDAKTPDGYSVDVNGVWIP